MQALEKQFNPFYTSVHSISSGYGLRCKVIKALYDFKDTGTKYPYLIVVAIIYLPSHEDPAQLGEVFKQVIAITAEYAKIVATVEQSYKKLTDEMGVVTNDFFQIDSHKIELQHDYRAKISTEGIQEDNLATFMGL